MSLHYLLDGYNIIHQIPGGIPESLKGQRQYLVELVRRFRLCGSLNNTVTIVFDGQTDIGGAGFFHRSAPRGFSRLKIVFSQNETADDKIKKIVSESHNSKNVVVVTNDREIQYAVRALGAKVKSVQDFLGKGKASLSEMSSRKKRVSNMEGSKRISKTVESDITSELKKIWLRGKN